MKHLLTGDERAGVDVAYDKHRQLVTLSGWYDTYVGIAPETVTLTHLLFALGITVGDCQQALESVRRSPCAICGGAREWTYFDGEAGVCIDPRACRARAAARAGGGGWDNDEA